MSLSSSSLRSWTDVLEVFIASIRSESPLVPLRLRPRARKRLQDSEMTMTQPAWEWRLQAWLGEGSHPWRGIPPPSPSIPLGRTLAAASALTRSISSPYQTPQVAGHRPSASF
eukprot:scaffold131583_cov32-Prasinocladus_malaysianus.AAC.1